MNPAVRRRGTALAIALALAACGRPAPYTVVRAPPGIEVARELPPPELRVLLFGDFGDDTTQQREVAAGLVRATGAERFDLAFSLGDNIYPCGPDVRLPGARECRFAADGETVAEGFTPPRDGRFERLFEAPLRNVLAGGTPLPIFLALGNHDVESGGSCQEGGLSGDELARLRACLEVAHSSPHWALPARHHVVDRGPARFVVIDSNVLVRDYGGFTLEQELAFVAEAARTAGDRLVFVVAHHPAATAGVHADELTRPERVERVRRLEEAGGGAITAWFAGHDHDLQHLRAPRGFDVFVSGNGARERPHERFEQATPTGAQLLFASTHRGFATLEVSRSHWAIRFESARGELLHCCRGATGARCEPVACRSPL